MLLDDMQREFGLDTIGAKPIDKKLMEEFMQSGGYRSAEHGHAVLNMN